jgi:hypothetical protein
VPYRVFSTGADICAAGVDWTHRVHHKNDVHVRVRAQNGSRRYRITNTAIFHTTPGTPDHFMLMRLTGIRPRYAWMASGYFSDGPSRNSMRFAYSGPFSKESVMLTYPKNGGGLIARNFYADGASGLAQSLGCRRLGCILAWLSAHVS